MSLLLEACAALLPPVAMPPQTPPRDARTRRVAAGMCHSLRLADVLTEMFDSAQTAVHLPAHHGSVRQSSFPSDWVLVFIALNRRSSVLPRSADGWRP